MSARFCVCGHRWDTDDPTSREHDHAGRTRDNAYTAAMTQADYQVENEAARRV